MVVDGSGNPVSATFAVIEGGVVITSLHDRNQATNPIFALSNDMELWRNYYVTLVDVDPNGDYVKLIIGRDPPVECQCGDNILTTNLGETCDDGNTDSGDGCSESCQIEVPLTSTPPPTTNPPTTTPPTTLPGGEQEIPEFPTAALPAIVAVGGYLAIRRLKK